MYLLEHYLCVVFLFLFAMVLIGESLFCFFVFLSLPVLCLVLYSEVGLMNVLSSSSHIIVSSSDLFHWLTRYYYLQFGVKAQYFCLELKSLISSE